MNKIELLAPAKNAEIGMAAINCGADAVYIGAEKFGAREDAGNSLSDIEKLIAHAHKFYARVYVALNTILKEDEIEEALRLINRLYSIGADGLIIQDVGLLECDLPPIPLIASTQMNSDSLEKILFLQNIGFKRVILPREMTLEEIREIKSKTTIELECFVHGSLCVSASGQCYLSYAIGGRSANRGACAQPCRHFYSLVDETGSVLAKGKHLLSLKDLNRSRDLKALIQAGVTSFKIEGRLKDLSYVKNIVGFYRKSLDTLIDSHIALAGSSGRVEFDFIPDPYKTFNRGYTDYGISGKKESMASIHTPKSLGEKIGAIKKIGSQYFVLDSGHDLKNGDGICFFDSSVTLRGTLINRVEGEKVTPDKMHYLEEKIVIYRNYDRAFIKALEQASCKRKIEVSFILEESVDGFKLEACDPQGHRGAFSMAAKKIPAEKKVLAQEAIQHQLSKLNDTVFSSAEIVSNFKDMYFIPFSVLNQLRRGVIEELLKEREKNRPKEVGRILKNDIPYPAETIDYLGNCLNKKAQSFYLRHGVKVVEWAAENGLTMSGRMVMVTRYCLKKELGLCGKSSEALYLIDESKRRLRCEFDCKECKMRIFFEG